MFRISGKSHHCFDGLCLWEIAGNCFEILIKGEIMTTLNPVLAQSENIIFYGKPASLRINVDERTDYTRSTSKPPKKIELKSLSNRTKKRGQY
jgi:hypothetical protein